MKTFLLMVALLLLPMLMSIHATYLAVVGPTSANLTNGQSIYLGQVGPGESFYVLASPTTTNASGSVVNIGWDTLRKVSLPSGWSSQASPLYENPMKMKVTVAPNAPNGRYNITIRAVNIQNYSKLGNLTFNAYVNVTQNVFKLNVNPVKINAGSGQPTDLYITINNTGISDDPFIIGAYGLPAWNITNQVVALHSSTSTFVYPVYVNEPGQYPFNLTVSSSTSPLIKQSYRINLFVQASLLNDYSAIGQGVVLSPVIFEPAYAFMLLLNAICHAVFG